MQKKKNVMRDRNESERKIQRFAKKSGSRETEKVNKVIKIASALVFISVGIHECIKYTWLLAWEVVSSSSFSSYYYYYYCRNSSNLVTSMLRFTIPLRTSYGPWCPYAHICEWNLVKKKNEAEEEAEVEKDDFSYENVRSTIISNSSNGNGETQTTLQCFTNSLYLNFYWIIFYRFIAFSVIVQ